MKHALKSGFASIPSSRLPLLLLWTVLIVAHLFLPTHWGDDAWFAEILAGELATPQNWAGFLLERYQTWSSRVAIEGLLILFVRFPLLWRVCNAAICILLTVAVGRIFNPEQGRLKNWILTVIFFLFPLGIFYEVGYVATTLNYLWPLSAILWAILPTAKRFMNRPVSPWEYGVALIALSFAAFQEQACAVLLALYLGGILHRAIAHRRLDRFSLIGAFICVGFLIYTFTCPGNQNRFALEEAAHFPGFSELTLLQRLELGFSSMMKTAFLTPNVFTAVFCLLLLAATLCGSTRLWVRVLSAFPFLTVLLCGLLGGALESVCPPIRWLRESVGRMGTAPEWQEPVTWIPLIFFILLLFTVLYLLSHAVRNPQRYWLFVYLLAVGAASRIVIGLSPTVWASGERTCTFLYAALAIVASYLLYGIISTVSTVCNLKKTYRSK